MQTRGSHGGSSRGGSREEPLIPGAAPGVWVGVLGLVGGVLLPALWALGVVRFVPRFMTHTPRPEVVAVAAVLGVAAGLAGAFVADQVWWRMGLPGRGPGGFLPFRWGRRQLARARATLIIEDAQRIPDEVSVDDLVWAARQVDRYSDFPAGRSRKVVRLSVAVAHQLGLGDEAAADAVRAAQLHDIGMLAVPAAALLEPGPLGPRAEAIRDHAAAGAALVAPMVGPEVVEAIRHHHERYDGGGYPDGLAPEQVSVLAALLAVVDAYEAMVSDRPYRSARSPQEAFDELRAVAGSQLDPEIVEALIQVETRNRIGTVFWATSGLGGQLRGAAHRLRRSAWPAAMVASVLTVAGAGSLGLFPTAASSAAPVAATPSVTLSPFARSAAPSTPSAAASSASPAASAAPSASAAAPAPAAQAGPAITSSTAPRRTSTLGAPAPAAGANPQGGTVTDQPAAPQQQPVSGGNPAPGTPNPPASSAPPSPPAGPAAPVVTGLSPSSGAGGITVTIHGKGFTGASEVTFGNLMGANMSITSDSSLSVTAPMGSGSVQVAVVGKGGPSRDAAVYTYLAPTVSSLSPSSGGLLGGTSVTITGAHFTGTQSVSFGALPALSFNVVSDTTLVATAPPGVLPLPVDVLVTTPAGQSSAGAGDKFTYK